MEVSAESEPNGEIPSDKNRGVGSENEEAV